MINSRMKDYFDLHTLRCEQATRQEDVARAIAATFKRRGTPIPSASPVGLTSEFALDEKKRMQWEAFLRKNRLDSLSLEEVIVRLVAWLQPAMLEAGVSAP